MFPIVNSNVIQTKNNHKFHLLVLLKVTTTYVSVFNWLQNTVKIYFRLVSCTFVVRLRIAVTLSCLLFRVHLHCCRWFILFLLFCVCFTNRFIIALGENTFIWSCVCLCSNMCWLFLYCYIIYLLTITQNVSMCIVYFRPSIVSFFLHNFFHIRYQNRWISDMIFYYHRTKFMTNSTCSHTTWLWQNRYL